MGSNKYLILDDSEGTNIEEQIIRIIQIIRTAQDKRLDGLKDLYRVHLDYVIHGRDDRIADVMFTNGLFDSLMIIFTTESDPNILYVACLLGCVLSEHLRIVHATAENKAARFIEHVLTMISYGPRHIRVLLLHSLARGMAEMPMVGEMIGQSWIVANAAYLLDPASTPSSAAPPPPPGTTVSGSTDSGQEAHTPAGKSQSPSAPAHTTSATPPMQHTPTHTSPASLPSSTTSTLNQASTTSSSSSSSSSLSSEVCHPHTLCIAPPRLTLPEKEGLLQLLTAMLRSHLPLRDEDRLLAAALAVEDEANTLAASSTSSETLELCDAVSRAVLLLARELVKKKNKSFSARSFVMTAEQNKEKDDQIAMLKKELQTRPSRANAVFRKPTTKLDPFQDVFGVSYSMEVAWPLPSARWEGPVFELLDLSWRFICKANSSHMGLFIACTSIDKEDPVLAYIFEYILELTNSDPTKSRTKRWTSLFSIKQNDFGYEEFVRIDQLQDGFLHDGHLTVKVTLRPPSA